MSPARVSDPGEAVALLRYRRANALVARAGRSGSAVKDRLWRYAQAAGAAHRGPFTFDGVKAWIARYGRRNWSIDGDAAEVLHGKQSACAVILWHDQPEEGAWMPWLGCHVEPARYRCPVCGYMDCDEGFAPCGSCGFLGTASAAAAIRSALGAAEKRNAAIARHVDDKLRDLSRRLRRDEKAAFRLV